MLTLFVLLACRREPPGTDGTHRDSDSPTDGFTDTSTDTDTVPHTDTDVHTDTDTDTDTHTDTDDGSGGTGAPLDTDVLVDTANAFCAGTPPTDTGILQDTAAPQVECDIVWVPPLNPGKSAKAGVLYTARIDGLLDSQFGRAVLPLGDLDHDGYGEYAVSGPGNPLPPPKQPAEVWIFSGSQTGILDRSHAVTILTGGDGPVPGGTGEGFSLELGDLTGDGVPDLIVGAYGGAAESYVVPLPLAPGEFRLVDVATVTIPVLGDRYSDNRSVGDYDGDGQVDLAMAGYGLADTGYQTGGVAVALGPLVAGFDPAPGEASFDVSELDYPNPGDNRLSGSGTRAFVPDVDGDGAADILVGGEDFANIAPPPTMNPYHVDVHGGLVLFTGGGLGGHIVADATAVLYGTCFSTLSAYQQSPVGDVTGDCIPDVAEGGFAASIDPARNNGAVFILSELRRARGYLPVTRASGAIIIGENDNDLLGQVGYLGDLNGDGFGDLAVGSMYATGSGAVYIFLGPVNGVINAGDADLTLKGAGQYFGTAFRGGRDITGDGVIDLLVGAYGSDSAYLFSGADLLGAM